ncbi:hypothetical protein LSAT2_004211 [Lamellibrachia satsuma]|nr:hypothetical protein LSAT2_004211 [Lamellibrachia satsuma]
MDTVEDEDWNSKARRKTRIKYDKWHAMKHRAVYALMATSILAVLVGVTATGVGVFDEPPEWELMMFFRQPPHVNKNIKTALEEESPWYSTQAVIMVLGSTAIIKGAFGFAVAVKHSMTLLKIYTCALITITVGESAGLAIGLLYYSKTQRLLNQLLRQSIIEEYVGATINENLRLIPSRELISEGWDNVMTKYECCGATSYKDFDSLATRWNRGLLFRGAITHAYVPVTCCKMTNSAAYRTDITTVEFVDLAKCIKDGDERYINTSPCQPLLHQVLSTYSRAPVIVASVQVLVDVVGLSASAYLLQMIFFHEKQLKKNSRIRIRGTRPFPGSL